MLNRVIVAVLTGSLFLFFGANIVQAQDAPPPSMPGQDSGFMISLSDVADALGLDEEDVRQAMSEGETIAELADEQGVSLDDISDTIIDAIETQLAVEVVDGKITEDEAIELLSQVTDNLEEWLTDGFSLWGGPGGMREMGMPQQYLDAAAEVLDMEHEELRSAMTEGQTVAEIAETQGVTVDDISAAILEAAEAQLADEVADGRLTQEEADERLAQIVENMVDWLENGFPVGGGPAGGMGMLGQYLPEIAEILGMDEDELQQEMMSGKSVADIADEAGIALEDISTALFEVIEAQFTQDVSDGKITQEQADEMGEQISNGLEAMLESPMNMMLGGGNRGGSNLDEALSEVLGIAREDLQKARQEGSSLETVAVEQGMTIDELQAALIDYGTSSLEQAVADGKMKQEQADQQLENLEERVQQWIENWDNAGLPQNPDN